MQRLARKPFAMCFLVRLVWTRPVRAGCGVQPQFVAQPPDLCGSDRAMDLPQCPAQTADRAANGKAARPAMPPAGVEV
jgi:hypothetical protein